MMVIMVAIHQLLVHLMLLNHAVVVAALWALPKMYLYLT
jgi:hypothetical protein